jgi:hypothetical protein
MLFHAVISKNTNLLYYDRKLQLLSVYEIDQFSYKLFNPRYESSLIVTEEDQQYDLIHFKIARLRWCDSSTMELLSIKRDYIFGLVRDSLRRECVDTSE